jgi:uncharacterized protein YndB with AHSA1/START domain
MPDRHAVLLEHEGRHVLRFERLLRHPRERVWRALTEREQLEAWHPTPFEMLAFQEPALIAYTWGPPPEDELRWTLDERDGGCLLTLEHSFADRFKAARDGAGWHVCLVALDRLLDGAEVPEKGSARRLPEGWSELNAEYQRRFGIAPEQATPIPEL